jgi:hypothetical protein
MDSSWKVFLNPFHALLRMTRSPHCSMVQRSTADDVAVSDSQRATWDNVARSTQACKKLSKSVFPDCSTSAGIVTTDVNLFSNNDCNADRPWHVGTHKVTFLSVSYCFMKLFWTMVISEQICSTTQLQSPTWLNYEAGQRSHHATGSDDMRATAWGWRLLPAAVAALYVAQTTHSHSVHFPH